MRLRLMRQPRQQRLAERLVIIKRLRPDNLRSQAAPERMSASRRAQAITDRRYEIFDCPGTGCLDIPRIITQEGRAMWREKFDNRFGQILRAL